jgi:hemolysin III
LTHTTVIVILSVLWGGAVLGVAMSLITPDAPAWVAAPLDVALGWVATFVLPELAHIGGLTALAQLLASGALSGRRGLLRNAMAKPLAATATDPFGN